MRWHGGNMQQNLCAGKDHRSWGMLRLVLFSALLMFMAAVIFIVYDLTFTPRDINLDTNTKDVNTAVEVTKDTAVSQHFHYDKALYGMSVLLGNPDGRAAGQIAIQVRELTTDSVLYDATIAAEDVSDGDFFFLGFKDKVTSEEGYEVLVSSEDAVSGSALSLWMSDTANDGVDQAVINGKAVSSSLAFTTCEDDASYQPLGLFVNRLVLVLLLFAFLLLHFLIDIPRMYDWIFRKRFYIAAAVVLLFVINQYNFSSISLYNNFFQYNYGSEYVSPIFGSGRNIRSDEWLAMTPARLSASFTDYAKTNAILRAAPNENFPLTGLHFCLAVLGHPTLWGYFLWGSAYGLSFSNITFLVGTFLVTFEMFLILTNRNRLFSLLGGVLVTCSSCFLWWSNVNWIMAAQGSFVCLYYFLHSDKYWKRILLIIGMAIFGSYFISEIYPAWQVPVGYLFLVLIVWMLIVNRERIKALRAWDWAILAAGLVLMAAICVSSFLESREYMKAIMNTAYPGRRISTGGYALDKLFGDLRVWSFPFTKMKDISYEGLFLNFYPLPGIAAILLLIKKKFKDGLLMSLLAVSFILTIYCTVGFPGFLAQATLMSYSTPDRAADIIGFIEVYLLILCLCRLEDMKRPKLIVSLVVFPILGLASVFLSRGKMTGLVEPALAAAALFCAVLLFSDIGAKWRRGAAICLICASVASALFVLPLSKGIDAIYSKPAAREIQMLNEGGEKRWISLNSYLSGNFLVALGAPAVTSVNNTPNYELWSAIDPDGTYKEIYDRYAICQIRLCEEPSHFVLKGIDRFDLYLSYKDIYKLHADYIFCTCKVADNPYVHFEQIYYEGGTYIYKPVYTQNVT